RSATTARAPCAAATASTAGSRSTSSSSWPAAASRSPILPPSPPAAPVTIAVLTRTRPPGAAVRSCSTRRSRRQFPEVRAADLEQLAGERGARDDSDRLGDRRVLLAPTRRHARRGDDVDPPARLRPLDAERPHHAE